jgi:aspartate beta-hydroxylase
MNKIEASSFAPVDAFLQEKGADEFPHGHGRSLYDHLMGTEAILRRWTQPEWVCNAGALHSIYGTDVYRRQLVPAERRPEVQALVGPKAERLAYLFGIVSRRDLFRQLDSGSCVPGEGLEVSARGRATTSSEHLSSEDIGALLVLYMANEIEQACAPDGSPALCLANLSRMSLLARPALAAVPPIFDTCRQALSRDDELAARNAYLVGLAAMSTDRLTAIHQLTQAWDLCPWVGEPGVWLAYLQLQQGDYAAAIASTGRAREVCFRWGTAWDKRLSGEQWLWLIDFIASLADDPSELGPLPAPDPQKLPGFLDQLERRNWVTVHLGFRNDDTGPDKPGSSRFFSYVASFARPDGLSHMRTYPGLRAYAWHEPQDFPLVRALENDYAEIRREILALDQRRFAPESESIRRSGNWSVLFFNERGRENEEVCSLCTVTCRALKAHRAIQTLTGMSYISRLSPGTHITPHHGPTNMRLRCHLPILVPPGNCAIRVDDETRQWEEGKCLVFDDFLLHEAWNHTAGDRLVLIVDLWHPDLTDEEVALLEGLHSYVAAQAASLTAYWSANEKARSAMDERWGFTC